MLMVWFMIGFTTLVCTVQHAPPPQKKMVEKDQTICHFLWLDLIFNAK
jgi:hypothetical protein